MVGDVAPERLSDALVAWYRAHGRPLAIRRLSDPYAIWLAETMSQQTQISRVGEALPGFLARFPDVPSLGAGSIGDVLRAWAGLGYPRRALALREAARVLVAHHDGRVPADVAALDALPGVGPYTARAVAATAFGIPVTALDVNARRVLGRVLGTPTHSRGFQEAADALAPTDRAADWNHALMDLGATVCRPMPVCEACPLRTMCAWAAGDRPTVAAGTAPQQRTPFRGTNRYVRGRVLARLRDAPAATWHAIDPDALSIEPDRVRRAMTQLQQEGLIEVDATGRVRLPLS